MTVGFPSDKPAIDARAGDIARRVRDVFTDVQRFQTFLAGMTDEALLAVGYDLDDVALLKSSYVQLDALRLVATGQTTVTEANDFTYFSRRLYGPN